MFGGEPKEVADMGVYHDADGRATVCEKRRIAGRFFEFMELYKFPFDVQVNDDYDRLVAQCINDRSR